MSPKFPQSNGYSADVRMHLSVNGHTLRIGQLGPDFIILRDAFDLPASEAQITVSIDGRTRQWSVQLPEGISAAKARTRIAV